MMLSRRAMLAAGLVATSAAGLEKLRAAAPRGREVPCNPAANDFQRAAEDSVVRLAKTPTVQQGRDRIAMMFRRAHGIDAPVQQLPGFDRAMDEFLASYLYKAVAFNAPGEGFVRFLMPEHVGPDGHRTPGSASAGENSDNLYRIAGLRPDERYSIAGRPSGPSPSRLYLAMTSDWQTSQTIRGIDIGQLRLAPDGSFTLTLDRNASDDPNHIQLSEDARFLFVRDTMTDWAKDNPYDLRISRVGAQAAPTLDDEALGAIAIRQAVAAVATNYLWHRMTSAAEPNVFRKPGNAAAVGGLAGQFTSGARFRLTGDDALLVSVDPSDAPYFSLFAYDWWYGSIESATRPSSLNSSTARLSPDGLFRFVVARENPGVANWIDTAGLEDGILTCRWQGISAKSARPPMVEARLIKTGALHGILPADAFISAEQHRTAMARRLAAFQRRWSDLRCPSI